MVRTQIYLTEDEKAALGLLSSESGKKQSEIIREAIDIYITKFSDSGRKRILDKAAGMWKDRDDLLDFSELRNEWNRDNSQ